MSQAQLDYRDCDREIWEEELVDFVPDRIFDAHIHLFWRSNVTQAKSGVGCTDANLQTLNEWADVLYPGRKMQYLILGTPCAGTDVAKHVQSVRQEIEGVPGVRHNRLVTPSCKVEDIERDLENPQFIGLKPYRIATGDRSSLCMSSSCH